MRVKVLHPEVLSISRVCFDKERSDDNRRRNGKDIAAAPKGVVDWLIREAPQKTYLIFNKKKNEVRCSRCGCTFALEECIDHPVVHNGKTNCPCCDFPAEYKESRYGRKSFTEYGRVLVFVRKRQTIYASLSKYIIDYQGDEPKVLRMIDDVYILNKKEQKRYSHTPHGYGIQGWHERKE